MLCLTLPFHLLNPLNHLSLRQDKLDNAIKHRPQAQELVKEGILNSELWPGPLFDQKTRQSDGVITKFVLLDTYRGRSSRDQCCAGRGRASFNFLAVDTNQSGRCRCLYS